MNGERPSHLRLVSGDAVHVPGGPAGASAPFRTSWTADELMAMTFPETRWAVPGVIAEGLNLLAGPPKVGKSWLSLATAIAVAGGGKALEAIPVERGPVLYLALEDTPRRLQSRMRKILGGKPAPRDLTLATSCPTLPQGGDEAIARWLERNLGARMVVIDVFAKVRGATAPGLSAYDADYAAMGRAKRLADSYGVAVVLVHHVRKMGSDDFLAEVSGTNGLAGAADATLVLKRARGTADGVLHVTGRDVEEAEYAMSFQPAAGIWHLLDGRPKTTPCPTPAPPSCGTSALIPATHPRSSLKPSGSATTTSRRPASAWPAAASSVWTPPGTTGFRGRASPMSLVSPRLASPAPTQAITRDTRLCRASPLSPCLSSLMRRTPVYDYDSAGQGPARLARGDGRHAPSADGGGSGEKAPHRPYPDVRPREKRGRQGGLRRPSPARPHRMPSGVRDQADHPGGGLNGRT